MKLFLETTNDFIRNPSSKTDELIFNQMTKAILEKLELEICTTPFSLREEMALSFLILPPFKPYRKLKEKLKLSQDPMQIGFHFSALILSLPITNSSASMEPFQFLVADCFQATLQSSLSINQLQFTTFSLIQSLILKSPSIQVKCLSTILDVLIVSLGNEKSLLLQGFGFGFGGIFSGLHLNSIGSLDWSYGSEYWFKNGIRCFSSFLKKLNLEQQKEV